MKVMLAALMMLTVTLSACASRQVEVNTGAPAATTTSLHMTNRLGQAVNVYVATGGSDVLVGQVQANSTQSLAVRGVEPGATVTLRATTTDGTRTYTKEGVTLSGTVNWEVP